MARPGLTQTLPDPAARRVLEGYLGELAAGLEGPMRARTAIVAEIADGLIEATATHQGQGLPPAAAAEAAVAEFGDAREVAVEFGATTLARSPLPTRTASTPMRCSSALTCSA